MSNEYGFIESWISHHVVITARSALHKLSILETTNSTSRTELKSTPHYSTPTTYMTKPISAGRELVNHSLLRVRARPPRHRISAIGREFRSSIRCDIRMTNSSCPLNPRKYFATLSVAPIGARLLPRRN